MGRACRGSRRVLRDRMRFPPSFLDEIRARVPVSEVVRQKVKLKKQGREWRGLSPFNAEKTPSFYVNDQKGFFHDFSSGKNGDAIAFLMETEGISFPEAVERLAAMAGLPMPLETPEQQESERKRASLTEVLDWAAEYFRKQLREPRGREAREYIERRKISAKMQALFGIGYAPPDRHGLRDALVAKGASVEQMIEAGLLIHGEGIAVPYDRFRNRVMFPIQDRAGKVIAFGGRALEKDAQAKYLNSPETPLFHKGETLYNLHNARKAAHEAGTVIAVEGYVDVIAMTEAGFPQTVAPLGTALTAEQCALLWRMAEEPILCFDGDKAGLKAAYRAIDTALPFIAPGKTLRFVLLPGGQDPDELLRAHGAGALAEALKAPLPLIELLWRRETEDHPLDTPERRATLERRLQDIAAQIADSVLRKHYGRELSDRLFQLFRGAGAANRRSRAPEPRENNFRANRGAGAFNARGGGGAASGPLQIGASLANSPLFKGTRPEISPRECLILLVFINHPELVADHIEDIAALEFEFPEASVLRDLMVRCVSTEASGHDEPGESLAGALAEAIAEAGLDQFVARLKGMDAHANLWSVQPGAATADAEVTLRQVLSLHRRVWALNKELRDIMGRLAENPSEEETARLAEIQRELSALDGTEAALEGFGSMSGRASRVL
jgi:DNA primase